MKSGSTDKDLIFNKSNPKQTYSAAWKSDGKWVFGLQQRNAFKKNLPEVLQLLKFSLFRPVALFFLLQFIEAKVRGQKISAIQNWMGWYCAKAGQSKLSTMHDQVFIFFNFKTRTLVIFCFVRLWQESSLNVAMKPSFVQRISSCGITFTLVLITIFFSNDCLLFNVINFFFQQLV